MRKKYGVQKQESYLIIVDLFHYFIFMRLVIFLWVFLWSVTVVSQPKICTNPPQMTSLCADACIICDIDGFTGRNNSSIRGQAPPDFCTTEVHHMQWIGFIAGTVDLSIEVTVSNCSRNQGLEIGLYESLNCQTFRRISECDTDIRPGERRVFVNTVPLTVGQYYYFVMDGSANDICDWSIKVLKGSTKVSPLEQAPLINFPDKICRNELFQGNTPGVSGATFYNWTLDGKSFKFGTSFDHQFAETGVYNICLDAFNVCDKAPQVCKKIEVMNVPESTIETELCFGECFRYLGTDYCQAGDFTIPLKANNGCDSLVRLSLRIKDKITASSSVNICEGDTIKLGGQNFFKSGTYFPILDNNVGCNIHMTLELKVIICNILTSTEITKVKCTGESNGKLSFKVNAGTPPMTYKAYKIENPSVIYNGPIFQTNEWITIDNLTEGNYTIEIIDDYQNKVVINEYLAQPPRLAVETKTLDYNGFGVQCHGDSNGELTFIPSGGTPVYQYFLNGTKKTTLRQSDLQAGVYEVKITDSNQCIITDTVSILSPQPLETEVLFINPGCAGVNTGAIKIIKTAGGVPDYLYSINNGDFDVSDSFAQLEEGLFTISVQDKNGCITKVKDTLIAADIPVISVAKEQLNTMLGDSIALGVSSNLTNQTVFWTPVENVQNPTSAKTSALPVNDTQYTVVVTSKDGCKDTAYVDVRVQKQRSFYICNVISPDQNAVNDRITYFAGNDVAVLNYYRLYDRWGNMVFESLNNDTRGVAEFPWDATFNGKKLQSGVYTWIANVAYIDDFVQQLQGSLTILY